jgi:ABC-type uncharacterized transport system substrate-binding protein
MNRRDFLALLGGAAAVYPLTVRAQQPARMSRIGWIAIGTPQGSEFLDAVREGLRQLDYVEGRSIVIEPRWPADIRDRVPELVRELLALNVQVIVAQGAIVPLVRRAIDSTPVVFGYSGDPVEAGLVNSLSRPGGNFTGATFMSYAVNAKRVELLHEAFPHVTRVAILSNPLHPGEQRELNESEHGAQGLGMGLSYAKMRSVAEIEPAFEHIRAAGAEAMIVLPDGLIMQHRTRIIEFAPAYSGYLWMVRIRQIGWHHDLRAQPQNCIPAARNLCRQDSQRSESGRVGHRATDHVRTCHQSQGGEGDRARGASDIARARRRGDRIAMPFAAVHESPPGTNAKCRPCPEMSAGGVRPDIPRTSRSRRV